MHNYKWTAWALLLFCVAACRNAAPVATVTNGDSIAMKMRSDLAPYFHMGRPLDAQRYLDSIVPMVKEVDDTTVTVAWNAYKGAAYTLSEVKDSARFYLTTAVSLAEQSKRPVSILTARIQLITFLVQQQRLDSALHTALATVSLTGTSESPELPLLYFQLASIYNLADDSFNHRRYLLEGLARATDSVHIAGFAGSLSRYYLHAHQPDSAEYYHQLSDAHKNSVQLYVEAKRQEDVAEMLIKKGERHAAIAALDDVIQKFRRQQLRVGTPYYKTGVLYTELGAYDKALTYLDTALLYYRQMGDSEKVSQTLYEQSKVLYKKGDTQVAYTLLDSSYAIHQIYDTSAFQMQAKEAEAKYSLQVKDERIASMAVKMNASHERNRQQAFIIGGLVMMGLLMILVGILIVRRRHLIARLRVAELQQRLLRGQMAPHFIFNCLAALQSHVRAGDTDSAIRFVQQFSRLLRIVLENSRKSFVSVQDEMLALDYYLSLQASMHEKSFDYHIEVDPDIDVNDILIPPMLIQPFVENAIIHGFGSIKEKGWVTVKLIYQPGALLCIVEDNGGGLYSTLPEGSKRSLSTLITKERLELLSRELKRKSGLTIEDKSVDGKGRGLRVTLVIPYKPI